IALCEKILVALCPIDIATEADVGLDEIQLCAQLRDQLLILGLENQYARAGFTQLIKQFRSGQTEIESGDNDAAVEAGTQHLAVFHRIHRQDRDAILMVHTGTLQCGAELRSEEHTSELQSRENLVCRL